MVGSKVIGKKEREPEALKTKESNNLARGMAFLSPKRILYWYIGSCRYIPE